MPATRIDPALLDRIVTAHRDLEVRVADEWKQAIWGHVVGQRCVELYEVTFVLTAPTDPSDVAHATGEIVDGVVRPCAPHWRDPARHTEPGQNYLRDWVDRANLQLLASGTDFALDVERLHYVLARDDGLNQRDCGDGKSPETADYIRDQILADPSPANPWRDRIIVVVRWGTGAGPHHQSCSSVDGPCILMGAYQDGSTNLDGQFWPGSGLLTHELGHYLGCVHTFPNIAPDIEAIATVGGALDDALALIRRWPYMFDQDNADYGLPTEVRVDDTGVDLGWGLSRLEGDLLCSGTATHTLEHYRNFQKVVGPDGKERWEPAPGSPIDTFDYTVTDDVRRNVMGYWPCFGPGKRFSPRQVARMRHVLDSVRTGLRHRRVCQNVYGIPYFEQERRVWPWEVVVGAVVDRVRRLAPRIPRLRGAIERRYARIIPPYRPLPADQLRARLLAHGLPSEPKVAGCAVGEAGLPERPA